jgi:hypothetical protein
VRFIQIIFILLAGLVATACAHVAPQANTVQRVSTDYVMVGQSNDVNAYLYGNVTVLEFKQNPDSLVVRDETGTILLLEKIGFRFRLPRRVDNFTAEINGVQSTFVFSGNAAPQARAKPRNADYQPVATVAARQAAFDAHQTPQGSELVQYQLLPADITLRGSIARWANLEGWTLVWELPPSMDPRINSTTSFNAASFPVALGILLDGLKAKGYTSIGVNLYSDRVVSFTQIIPKP